MLINSLTLLAFTAANAISGPVISKPDNPQPYPEIREPDYDGSMPNIPSNTNDRSYEDVEIFENPRPYLKERSPSTQRKRFPHNISLGLDLKGVDFKAKNSNAVQSGQPVNHFFEVYNTVFEYQFALYPSFLLGAAYSSQKVKIHSDFRGQRNSNSPTGYLSDDEERFSLRGHAYSLSATKVFAEFLLLKAECSQSTIKLETGTNTLDFQTCGAFLAGGTVFDRVNFSWNIWGIEQVMSAKSSKWDLKGTMKVSNQTTFPIGFRLGYLF